MNRILTLATLPVALALGATPALAQSFSTVDADGVPMIIVLASTTPAPAPATPAVTTPVKADPRCTPGAQGDCSNSSAQ